MNNGSEIRYCARCRRALDLVADIPPVGKTPGLRIYFCPNCESGDYTETVQSTEAESVNSRLQQPRSRLPMRRPGNS